MTKKIVKYIIVLIQKANVVERTKMRYKWTFENINKYHEYNTSVSHMKSQIIVFGNFYIWQKLFAHFHQISSFTRKWCCPYRPIECEFALSNGNILFSGERPNCHLIENTEIWTLPQSQPWELRAVLLCKICLVNYSFGTVNT